MSAPHLFVWRDSLEFENTDVSSGSDTRVAKPEPPAVYAGYETVCPFCGGTYRRLKERHENYAGGWLDEYSDECVRCGFTYTYEDSDLIDIQMQLPVSYLQKKLSLKILKRMDVNSAELGLEELGTHLKRSFTDVYSLEPRRFEELVADVYAHLGYIPRLTQQSRDGGYDIALLERSTGKQIIVECKRYAAERRVRVGTVRELLGVQLATGIPNAMLVTTATFTDPAMELANSVGQGLSGYSLELIDAERLARALEIYDISLPPLEQEFRARFKL